MKKVMIILFMAAAVVLPTMAQSGQQDQNMVFQSTSTMQGSGSAYSSTPMLNADGTASTPSSTSGGPRKIGGLPGSGGSGSEGMPDTSEAVDNTPIGDAALPLLLMAAAGATLIALRQRKMNKA